MSIYTSPETSPSPIAILCSEYVQSVEAMAESLPFIMSTLIEAEDTFDKKLDAFIDFHAIDVEKLEDGRRYGLKLEDKSAHDRLHRRIRVFREALGVTPRSFLVALVSAYDAFLGRLIRSLFYARPELLNSSERVLTFAQLQDLQTLDAAREYLVEKEVESVLRKSHSQQFEWLEKTFSVPLRKGLECWPRFIELTERRNLFVHADGIVSSQYLNVCGEHGVTHSEVLTSGTRLHVERSYFQLSAHCLMEIGIKLAHVLWRKLVPTDREKADENLIEIVYDLLIKQKYRLAADLASFGTNTIKSHGSDQTRRILVVNLAIAHKFGGDAEKCTAVLDAEDWSATADDFRLAIAALRDNFDEAAKLMKSIGKDNRLGMFEYREWPVFRDFRKSYQFAAAYKEVFGEEFVLKAQEPKASESPQTTAKGENVLDEE
uniref:Uncharacterized protein n=1 Tax=Chlorobium chlorochromatii (strain CaD3) TaxID=340177 RepID=Q3ATF7_CHLCH